MALITVTLVALVMGFLLTPAGLDSAAATTHSPTVNTPNTANTTNTPNTADLGSGGVSISVTSLTPTVVTPEDTVTVRVAVTNNGLEPLQDTHLSLAIVRYRISTPAILENWFSGAESLLPPTALDGIDIDEPIGPGESETFTLSAPATDLRLLAYPDAAGPRGILVRLVDRVDGAVLGQAKTFLLWYPSSEVEPVRVSLLVPITGPAPTPADHPAWEQRINSATGPEGRLAAVLNATGSHKFVTWAVDPALIEFAAQAAPPSAGWAQNLLTASLGREVYALDPFDPDVQALAQADISPFLTATTSTTTSAMAGWRTDLTLPRSDVVDLATVIDAVDQNRPLVMIGQGLDPAQSDPATLMSTAILETGVGPATALLPEQELSALLTDPASAGLGSTFEAHQLLLTRLAVISQVGQVEPQHVLLTTPRDWHPNATETDQLLTELSSVPFINVMPLAGLLGSPPRASDRSTLPSTSPIPAEGLDAQTLQRAHAQVNDVRAFATITADPDALIAGYVEGLAAVTASVWANNPREQRHQMDQALGAGTAILTSLSVVPGSTVNLISDRGDLPVTIRNDLPQEVTVTVGLVANDPRLSITKGSTITIPADSATTANIPATAIGSGNVDVRVELLTEDGAVIAAPSTFTVRVRADWESLGTAVIGGLLVIVLGIGIVRTIRRGKKATRMEPVIPPAQEAP